MNKNSSAQITILLSLNKVTERTWSPVHGSYVKKNLIYDGTHYRLVMTNVILKYSTESLGVLRKTVRLQVTAYNNFNFREKYS